MAIVPEGKAPARVSAGVTVRRAAVGCVERRNQTGDGTFSSPQGLAFCWTGAEISGGNPLVGLGWNQRRLGCLSFFLVLGNAGMTEPTSDVVAKQRRILVVEDEMLIGMLLEDMLVDMGHVVVAVVPRVNEALAAVEREAFDIAILDVHLNGQAVYPVAESLISRGIPFVFATGYGERGLPEQYRGRPILQKPFSKEDLARMISALP
jgi:CheY-like chemotaxis protein